MISKQGAYKAKMMKLAASDPREFLYMVYRDGPFANLEVFLIDLSRNGTSSGKVQRRWAVEPANDGLLNLFNKKTSLLAAINEFSDEHRKKWVVPGPHPGSASFEPRALCPATLIPSLERAVSLSRSVSRHSDQETGGFCDGSTVAENCDLCEKFLLPLLREMPPLKNMAQYPDLKPAPPAAQP